MVREITPSSFLKNEKAAPVIQEQLQERECAAYFCWFQWAVSLIVTSSDPSAVFSDEAVDDLAPESWSAHVENDSLCWSVADRHDRTSDVVITVAEHKRFPYDLFRIRG